MKINWKKILEHTKLFAETLSAVAPIIKIIAVSAGAFALALVIGDFRNKGLLNQYAAESKKHQEATQVALAQVESYKAAVAKLQTEAASIERNNSELEKSIKQSQNNVTQTKQRAAALSTVLRDSTKTQKDSIEILTHIIPVKDSIIEQQDSVIAKQDTTINNYVTLVENKNSQIEKLQISLNTLDSIVKTIPVYDPCEQKFFFCKINKPSRKTALITGFGIGVLTAGVILR